VSWIPERAEGSDAFERCFGLRPNLFAAWSDFAARLWDDGPVDPTVLELCRMRIGQLLGAICPLPRGVAAPPLAERKAAELSAWWRSDAYDETERACLRFAEQFALDARGIEDAEAGAVTGALGDAGTVAFVEALAIFDGFARFARILDAGDGA
jgi:alkylhydroperoxidase family enzyme